ncbi:alpha/beta fold hydrolase [Dactylosporangium sp. CS-047395]|uniref:alpha/beta fold hydrolase n=1 Tax=Dactylosporangium sp. CS-047395 TaxID=3239936 RepID=UPI003D8CB210
METFTAFDGTVLAYHAVGGVDPVLCVPGGPMQDSSYLDGLGSLRLDLRGTGDSAVPSDPATFRCERQADDLEALRLHLGLDALALLAHSAGAAIAVHYAARFPDRVARLTLVTPSPRAVGIEVTDDDRRAIAVQRRAEPWFPPAFAALERIWAGAPTDEDWAAITPFVYGRWDDRIAAYAAEGERRTNRTAAAAYYSGDFLVGSGLDRVTAPVLVVGGELDIQLPPAHAARYAALFPNSSLVVAPAAGHFPWLDDPDWFAATVGVTLKGIRG